MSLLSLVLKLGLGWFFWFKYSAYFNVRLDEWFCWTFIHEWTDVKLLLKWAIILLLIWFMRRSHVQKVLWRVWIIWIRLYLYHISFSHFVCLSFCSDRYRSILQFCLNFSICFSGESSSLWISYYSLLLFIISKVFQTLLFLLL